MNLKYRRNQQYFKVGIFIIGAILFISLLTWANFNYSKGNPGGYDFLTHWIGTRELFFEGSSPYNEQAVEKVQEFTKFDNASIEQKNFDFEYPLYSVAVYFPFALIPDFIFARALWMTLLEVSLILIVYFSFRLVNWEPGILKYGLILLFILIDFHSLYALINGNMIILITLFITVGVFALKIKADELAGVLLALSTIKLDISILILVFIFSWALKNQRLKMVGWFFATLLVLSLSTMLLQSNWILEFLLAYLRNFGEVGKSTIANALVGIFPGLSDWLTWVIAGLFSINLLMEWRAIRKNMKLSSFLWVLGLTMVIVFWIGIPSGPIDFILLFPVLIFIFSLWDGRWKSGGLFFILASILLLGGGIWLLVFQKLKLGVLPYENTSLFLPLPAYLYILLYWVKWWAVKPTQQIFEDEITNETSILGDG
ncbi:MAG: DUF2029 domain-containing protein [Bacteroidales bacterium]|nr:DUF2029 domain-containing protein [Bacteroidales bacterium]